MYYAIQWPHGVATNGNTNEPWYDVFRFESKSARDEWVNEIGHEVRSMRNYRQCVTRKEVEHRIRRVERYFDSHPAGAWMDTDGPEMLNE